MFDKISAIRAIIYSFLYGCVIDDINIFILNKAMTAFDEKTNKFYLNSKYNK